MCRSVKNKNRLWLRALSRKERKLSLIPEVPGCVFLSFTSGSLQDADLCRFHVYISFLCFSTFHFMGGV